MSYVLVSTHIDLETGQILKCEVLGSAPKGEDPDKEFIDYATAKYLELNPL